MDTRNGTAKGKTCERAGCARSVVSRNLCASHYQQARANGQIAIRERYEVGGPCGVVGCERPRSVRGLCATHYSRERNNGNPLIVRRAPKTVRIIPDEKSPAKLARILGVSRQRAHQILNRDAHNTRHALNRAVAAGEVRKPGACERCQKQTADLEAHHWDYREVLDVRWLCPPCHSIVHPHHPGSQRAISAKRLDTSG